MNNRWSVDLLIMVALGSLAVVLVLTDVATNSIGRILVGVPLVLVLPGSALTAAAFPDRSLSRVDRVVVSIGLSLSLAAVGAPVLAQTAGGVRPVPWALFLGGITILGSAVAAYRRRFGTEPVQLHPTRWPAVRQWTLLGMACVVTLSAIMIATVGAAQRPPQSFTQLWLVPAAQRGQGVVQVGIENSEAGPMSYRLQMLDAEAHEIGDWALIELDRGGRWQELVAPVQDTGGSLEARLYRNDAPQVVYRRVRLDTANGQD